MNVQALQLESRIDDLNIPVENLLFLLDIEEEKEQKIGIEVPSNVSGFVLVDYKETKYIGASLNPGFKIFGRANSYGIHNLNHLSSRDLYKAIDLDEPIPEELQNLGRR